MPALRFHWLTPVYDSVVAVTTRERTVKHALVEQVGPRPRERILDLGSGTGTLAVLINQREPLADITGIDADPAVVAVAVRKAQRVDADVRFSNALSHDLPFRNGHFDCVVSSLFFHHLEWESKLRTADELSRVLRPGGQLHVADWGRATNVLMRGLFLAVQVLDGFESTRDNVSGWLPDLFRGAGFVDVSETRAFDTMLGTLALYRAVKPR